MNTELDDMEQAIYEQNTNHELEDGVYVISLHLDDENGNDMAFTIDADAQHTNHDQAVLVREHLARGLAKLTREHSGAYMEALRLIQKAGGL